MMILVKCKSIQGLYCLLKRTPSESTLIDKAFVLYYKNSTAQLLIAVRPPYFHSIVQSIAYFLTPHCQILHEDAFYCS